MKQYGILNTGWCNVSEKCTGYLPVLFFIWLQELEPVGAGRGDRPLQGSPARRHQGEAEEPRPTTAGRRTPHAKRQDLTSKTMEYFQNIIKESL